MGIAHCHACDGSSFWYYRRDRCSYFLCLYQAGADLSSVGVRRLAFPANSQTSRPAQQLPEHHRLAAVQNNPMLDMPLDSPRERHALNIAANPGELLRRHTMINALDFLLNDGTFIKIRSHIVRSRTNQLNATIKSLIVRLGPLEARQERVVNIDRPTRQPIAQLR